jgi:hypothetical protein
MASDRSWHRRRPGAIDAAYLLDVIRCRRVSFRTSRFRAFTVTSVMDRLEAFDGLSSRADRKRNIR